MERERYIKDHQADFDSMIEAAELMAQDWIKQGFNPWESWGLADVRMAKEWSSFLGSEFYRLYNKITFPIKHRKLPGEAFNLFTSAIDTDSRTEVTSFKRDYFIYCYNGLLQRASGDENFVFEYKSAQVNNNFASDFDIAINRLSQKGKTGESIIKVISRLKEGQDNWWNPYWINSATKLGAIISAILKIDNETSLETLVENPESELYQALNIQRLAPITFFGRLGFYHAKSLMVVEEDQQLTTSNSLN